VREQTKARSEKTIGWTVRRAALLVTKETTYANNAAETVGYFNGTERAGFVLTLGERAKQSSR
jgi:hypothetical protein